MKVIFEYDDDEMNIFSTMLEKIEFFSDLGLMKSQSVSEWRNCGEDGKKKINIVRYSNDVLDSKVVVNNMTKDVDNVLDTGETKEIVVEFEVEQNYKDIEFDELVEYVKESLVKECFSKDFLKHIRSTDFQLTDTMIWNYLRDELTIYGDYDSIEYHLDNSSMEDVFDYDEFVDSIFTKNSNNEIDGVKIKQVSE